MFLQFFTSLRDAQVPVTLREYLTLMEALNADLADQTVENFYYLSRAALVKDERNLDKFDRVFGSVFKGLESLLDAMEKAEIPAEWLRKAAEKYLTEEENNHENNETILIAHRNFLASNIWFWSRLRPRRMARFPERDTKSFKSERNGRLQYGRLQYLCSRIPLDVGRLWLSLSINDCLQSR